MTDVTELPVPVTQHVNRDVRATASTSEKTKEGAPKMKKFGFATAIASGFAAGFIGLAVPAVAAPAADASTISASVKSGVDHLDWLDDIQPMVNVPKVDTSPRSNP
jgi:hypothetical protein